MNNLRMCKISYYIRILIYILAFSIVINLSNIASEIRSYLQINIMIIIIICIMTGIIYSVNKKRIYIDVGLIIYIFFTYFYISIGLIRSSIDTIIPYILSMTTNLILIYILSSTFDNRIKLNKLFNIIKYAGLTLGILGILEFLNIFSLTNLVGISGVNSGNRVGSTWINPNMYGFALVFSYICSLNSDIVIKEVVIKCIIFISIIISMSRSALIMLVICNITYMIILKKINISIKKILTIGFTLIIIYTFTSYIVNNIEYVHNLVDNSRFDRLEIFENSSLTHDISNGRKDALKSALYIGIRNPILGVGIKQIPKYSINGQSAHNMYINIFGESGVIPALIYIIMIIYICTKSIKLRKDSKNRPICVTLSIFIFLYGFFSHTLITNYIIGLCIGIIFACIRFDKKID